VPPRTGIEPTAFISPFISSPATSGRGETRPKPEAADDLLFGVCGRYADFGFEPGVEGILAGWDGRFSDIQGARTSGLGLLDGVIDTEGAAVLALTEGGLSLVADVSTELRRSAEGRLSEAEGPLICPFCTSSSQPPSPEAIRGR